MSLVAGRSYDNHLGDEGEATADHVGAGAGPGEGPGSSSGCARERERRSQSRAVFLYVLLSLSLSLSPAFSLCLPPCLGCSWGMERFRETGRRGR